MKKIRSPETMRSLLLKGEELSQAGRAPEARAFLDEVLTIAMRERSSTLAAEALTQLSWLAWIELDGEQTRKIAAAMRSLNVPMTSPEAFRLFVGQAMVELQLGDALTASKILEEAEEVSRDADIESFIAYLSLKADVLAGLGKPEDALSYARLAADISAKRHNGYSRWRCAAYLAYSLHANGHLRDAYTAYLSAELLAKNAGLSWEVEHTRARRAWIAFLLGRVGEAHEIILSCFERDVTQLWARVTRAWIGIFIGLARDDADLIERCADPSLLESAMRSADFYSIGPAAAAFHTLYLHQHRDVDARDLLSKAIALMPSPDTCWSLLLSVAYSGNDDDVARARHLLHAFPRAHRVAEAHRRLFNAILAHRAGDRTRSETLAGEARLLFEDVESEYHAALCLEVGGRLSEAHQRFAAMGAVQDATRLRLASARRGRPRQSYEATRQRREIVTLLLEGKTTAQIAERFGVTTRTVKNRLAEIYSNHGVTSRAELRAKLQGDV